MINWLKVKIGFNGWWSSGQRARLLLRQSEFESRWGLQFFCKIVIEKNENKQKEAGVGPFFLKKKLDLNENVWSNLQHKLSNFLYFGDKNCEIIHLTFFRILSKWKSQIELTFLNDWKWKVTSGQLELKSVWDQYYKTIFAVFELL